MEVDAELVVPDAVESLDDGAIAPWASAHVADYFSPPDRRAGRRARLQTLDTPWGDLPAEVRRTRCCTGTRRKVHVHYKNRYGRERSYWSRVRGRDRLRRAPARRDRVRHQRGAPRGLHARGPVPGVRRHPAQAGDPGGHARLRPARPEEHRRGLAPVDRARPPTTSATLEMSDRERQIGERVLKEIHERLRFLLDVGLDYLALDRARRLAVRRRGAAHPPRDADRRRPGRRALRPRRAVDRPAPARQPPPDRDARAPARPRQHADRRRARRGHDPGRRLGRRHRPRRRRARRPGHRLRPRRGAVRSRRTRSPAPVPVRAASRSPCPTSAAHGATRAASSWCAARSENNLKNIDVTFPLGSSSPSRASPARASPRWSTTSSTRRWPARSTTRAPCPGVTATSGLEQVDKVIHVDQSPIGRTPRSNPATYTGVFDHVRKLFAADARGEDARLPAGTLLASTSRAAAARRAPATARSRSR